jgi:hypothetical protein
MNGWEGKEKRKKDEKRRIASISCTTNLGKKSYLHHMVWKKKNPLHWLKVWLSSVNIPRSTLTTAFVDVSV